MGNNRQEHGRETVCMSVCVWCVCMRVWDVYVHACACVFVGCCLATKTLNVINTKSNGWR